LSDNQAARRRGGAIKRRTFLTRSAAGTAAATTGAVSAPAISQGLRDWRMVTSWPKGLPGLGTGAERLADRITRLSGGRISVKVYAANELVPALGVFDAVAEGTAQLGHDAAYYHLGKSEGCAFYTSFPWGFTANEIEAWVGYGNGQALWDEMYAPFGIRGFLAGNTGTQMLGWFREEIRSIEDFQGLKFRAPGNQGKILQKLGATPVVLAGGEIFPALQSGAVDGAEWVGPYNDLSLGFYQVCKFYYSYGYHEPGAALQLTINEQAWQSLSSELQAIVKAACDAANQDMLAEYNARSGPALRTLVQDHGVQVRALPEDVLMACGRAANEVLNEVYEGGTPIVRRIVEDFLAFRKDIMPWTRIGEQAFINARRLPFEFGLR
jgi:TRAP-type mannitol/chloroaromatic compound transport system substrate-binding protein